MSTAVHASLADVRLTPYWLDDPGRPAARAPLTGELECDLAVVGGGYSGLWTALIAKERDPGLDVVLVEGDRIGHAASGRNGGFCQASLTHGIGNGLRRWPDELGELERLGAENLAAIEAALMRYDIRCDFERTGALDVATAPHHVELLRGHAEAARALGAAVDFLDAGALREEIDSPAFLAGIWDRDGTALLHPARLAWGLAEACERLGVRVFEGTPVTRLTRDRGGIALHTGRGRLRAGKVALGTNVFPSLLRRTRPYVVPVYDYALVTEPLTARQRAAIGWRRRQGMSDCGNQFHYFRQTRDHRILWGGYDAVYHFGGQVRPAYEHRPATYDKLAAQFFTAFPQLEGVRFTHAWGGAIDTCTRFSAFFGTGHRGRVAYAAGFTGLGVGATRFGAEVMLDLLAGADTARTRTRMVRSRPLPFPPEPVRWAGVQLTRQAMISADAHGGRRNLWLRAMDRIGFGFDS
ncbi:FAD-dependent oxidoreductase [Dactylosporangium sp. NPDC049140]|jgi:glycine/D-amino acid oxidase-like deaminating enzyme|uniref:NAD(P)/FAD-dependent oxidoreductase n=1 Tax=unclassified Dactylosporangium TaxID=2621675 RepID=UPI0033C63F95